MSIIISFQNLTYFVIQLFHLQVGIWKYLPKNRESNHILTMHIRDYLPSFFLVFIMITVYLYFWDEVIIIRSKRSERGFLRGPKFSSTIIQCYYQQIKKHEKFTSFISQFLVQYNNNNNHRCVCILGSVAIMKISSQRRVHV